MSNGVAVRNSFTNSPHIGMNLLTLKALLSDYVNAANTDVLVMHPMVGVGS